MKRTLTNIFYPAIIVTLIVINILFLTIIKSRKENNDILYRYKAEKILSQLLFAFQNNEIEKAVEGYSEIKAFGIYNRDGSSVFLYGNAPGSIFAPPPDPEMPELDRQNEVFRIMRPLSPTPPMNNQMNNQMGNMMHRPGKVALLEVSIAGLKRTEIVYSIVMVAVPLFLTLLTVMLMLFYRKNDEFRLKLEKQNELARLGEVSRTLTHEIKNPLGAIRLQTGLLKKLLPDNFREEIAVIEEETSRLTVISERIGDFLRDPIGTREPLNITLFMENLRDKFAWPITLSSEKTALYIAIDGQRFRSIIENLIRNSIESLEESGKESAVEINITHTGKSVTIEISDNGKGLKEESERIFDPFYTTKTKGSGIGLSIVKRFTEAAGGTITISNRKEGGVTARLEFQEEFV